jgi:hypothetical protein
MVTVSGRSRNELVMRRRASESAVLSATVAAHGSEVDPVSIAESAED